MRKTQPNLTKRTDAPASVLSVRLPRLIDSYILSGDISRRSERTLEQRRDVLGKLVWFLRDRESADCGTYELKEFMRHVTHGHKEPGGRWGNARNNRPTTPCTAKNYHAVIRAFFNDLVREEELDASPMDRVPVPIDRPDQVDPFTDDQLLKIMAASKKTLHPRRDEAIVLLLLDTGMRASELVGLRVKDIDLSAGMVAVEGKGGKARHLPISRDTKRSLFLCLNERETEPDEIVFLSDRGTAAGSGLTRHGLRFLIGRICQSAGIDGVRCSPHTFRHTFAISFLRAGGNQFSLMNILGHTNTQMTARYVALSQADIAAQHRHFSPVTRIKGRGR